MMTASKQITLNKGQMVEVKFVNTNVAKNSGVTYCNFIFIKNI